MQPEIIPLSDDELLAIAGDAELASKLTSEERRRLTRLRPQARTARDSVVDFGKEALAGLNPVAINRGIQQAFWHPIETAKAIHGSIGQLQQKGLEAFRRGDPVQGTAEFVNSAIPFFGSRISESQELLRQGEYARGLGAATDVAAQVAGPTALANIPQMRVSPAMRPRNPVQREAVAFAQREGVPLTAGEASGRPLVQRMEQMAASNPGGAGIAEPFRIRQADKLTQVGEDLARQSYPSRPITPEYAGQGVRDAVTGQIRRANDIASEAYERVRQAELNPRNRRRVQVDVEKMPDGTMKPVMQEMALPVDLRAVKQALAPTYVRLTRLYPIAKRQASAGYQAIENIVKGPDHQPLSVADDNLGAIKQITREADMPELRNVSQGLAAQAVKQLDAAVQETARSAGISTISALRGGRKATVIKHQAADVLDATRVEPVRAFEQAISANDAGINHLRETARFAPHELPKVGRAYLDDLMQQATAEGGFGHTDRLFASWQKLGPETKRMLFQDPAYIKDLDDFFMLAKNVGRVQNPSGTALSLNATKIGAVLPNWAMAKLLYSPTGVRLLTQGLRIPVRNRAARAAWTAEVSRALGEMEPAMLPAAAEGSREDPK